MDGSKLLTEPRPEGNARKRRNSAMPPGGATRARQRTRPLSATATVVPSTRQCRKNNKNSAAAAQSQGSRLRHLGPDTPRPMGKPLAAAHEQLELMLTRIERGSETSQTTASGQQATRRRAPPTAGPLNSARSKELQLAASEGDVALQQSHLVPLTQNPQLLLPEQRRALLELLSRGEQQTDQQIVQMLSDSTGNAGDPSRDAMRCALQMLPLALKPGDSPYCKRFWAGRRYLKERQQLRQQLHPDDVRYKEVKILRSPNGKFFLSKTLEDELNDEKQVLDFIDSQLYSSQQKALTPEQRTRQQQALDERAELDRQKQKVSEWRRRHQLHEQRREKIEASKLAKQMREKPQQKQLAVIPTEERKDGKQKMELQLLKDAMPEQLKQLYLQRQQFQLQCQQSNFYNNRNCPAPWKLFSNIAGNLSAQLAAQADAELHRSIAGYLKDFVENKPRFDNQSG